MSPDKSCLDGFLNLASIFMSLSENAAVYTWHSLIKFHVQYHLIFLNAMSKTFFLNSLNTPKSVPF